MTLSDLASIGSFVSGVAVVVTLVFLLFQMRQVNLNQRALMQQMRSARTIDTILTESGRYLCETMALAFGNSEIDETQTLSFVQPPTYKSMWTAVMAEEMAAASASPSHDSKSSHGGTL